MAEPPFIYPAASPRPVEPGGTRVRVPRRRPRDQETGAEGDEDKRREEDAWRTLLAEAVDDLNASFRRAGAPFLCVLDEDESGYTLHVRREGADGPFEELEEEPLAPQDLDRWLARIRAGLGLLVDEKA